MKKPLDEIQLGNSNNNENDFKIAVFEEFVIVSVSLTFDESYKAMQIGGVEQERKP